MQSIIVYREDLPFKALEDFNTLEKTKFSTIINLSIKDVIETEGYKLFLEEETSLIVSKVVEEFNNHLLSGYYDHVLNYNFEVDSEQFAEMIDDRLKKMRKKKPTAKQVELFNTLKENLSFHDIDVPTDFLLFEEYLTNFINYNKKFGKPTDKQLDSVLKRWENRYGVKLFPSACTDREEISMLFKALEMTPSNGEDFIKIYREKRRTRLQDILIKTKNKEKLNFEEEWYFKNDLNYTFMNGYSLFCENREVDLVAPFDEDEYCDSLEGEVFVEIDNELFKHTDKYKELIAVYTTLGYLKETGFQRVFELNDIISLSGLSEFEVSNALKTLVTERFVSIEVFSSTIFYYNETIKPEKTITSIELKCVKNVLELYKNKELSKDAFETYIYLHSLATEDLETNGKYKSGDLSFVSEDIWNELIAANKVKRETNGDFNRISIN